jgi:hypothetical protein
MLVVFALPVLPMPNVVPLMEEQRPDNKFVLLESAAIALPMPTVLVLLVPTVKRLVCVLTVVPRPLPFVALGLPVMVVLTPLVPLALLAAIVLMPMTKPFAMLETISANPLVSPTLIVQPREPLKLV